MIYVDITFDLKTNYIWNAFLVSIFNAIPLTTFDVKMENM